MLTLGTADFDAFAFDLFISDPIFCLAMLTLNDQDIFSLTGLAYCFVLDYPNSRIIRIMGRGFKKVRDKSE